MIDSRQNVAYWHIASFRCAAKIGRYWVHSGHWSAFALNGSVANDPMRQLGSCCDNKAATGVLWHHLCGEMSEQWGPRMLSVVKLARPITVAIAIYLTPGSASFGCGGALDVFCNIGKAVEKGAQDVGHGTERIWNQARTDLSNGLN